MRKLTLIFAVAATLAFQLEAQAPAKKEAQAPAKKPAAAAAKPAIDKAKIEAYVRHLFVWPPPIEITVGDPQPSPVDNFYEVKVRGSQGNSSQEESFYVSKDSQKIIRGSIYDASKNPFKDTNDKLKTEYQPNFGTPGAPVVLVEFSDFECPYCREESKVLRDNLLTAYPKDVHFYYVDFPLESLHPWAKAASIAGRCILHQNASAFWDYHDWVFAHQDDINPDNLKDKVVEFAATKGVDGAQFGKCIDTRATEEEVNKAKAIGQTVDVTSTPTLFVNGRPMVGVLQWPDLKRVIDFEIEYQKTAKNAGENCGCDVKLAMPGLGPQAASPLGFPKAK